MELLKKETIRLSDSEERALATVACLAGGLMREASDPSLKKIGEILAYNVGSLYKYIEEEQNAFLLQRRNECLRRRKLGC